MNSEELELSLRSEFENYLNGVFAGMRQDVADYQKNFEAEFDKHKSQMDEAFRNISARFDSDVRFDKAFTESVVEHLRLARDDGAQLSAEAFAEAQQLEKDSGAPAEYNVLRDAINDISGQLTQSAILKSLVDRVSHFTPRGAFFIVKHDNFVCWRKFDANGHADDDAVRSIHLSAHADTILADAVRLLTTQKSSESSNGDNEQFLDSLGFGHPDRMFAVPLMARGRAVAILYADHGNGAGAVNVEAIESLVRVAGLTVELRAAASAVQPSAAEAPSYVPAQEEEEQQAESVEEPAETPQYEEEAETSYDVEEPAAVSYDAEEPAEMSYAPEESAEEPQAVADAPEYVEEYTGAVAVEEPSYEISQTEYSSSTEEAGYFSSPEPEAEPEAGPEQESYSSGSESVYSEMEPVQEAPAEPVNDFAFASSDTYDASAEEAQPEPVEEYSYAGDASNGTNGHSYEAAPEPVVEVAVAQPAKSRLSDRNVDLPIEVADDERRLHNDARRFARLLVSEIKLYNEQKVNEGRDSADLYDRLREAIDRSREMYDKRVQPQVAAKFDYFHYELVSNLAQGNDSKLGASYPGATV